MDSTRSPLALVILEQVQQQVIEVITHIALTATKFPKKCAVLSLSGR